MGCLPGLYKLMGRRKLTMKTLQNRKACRALFERRKKGLLKKASELSTLCGIDACVIIFPPPDSENLKVETFPQNPTEVIRNIQQYNAKKQRKNYDLREFFNDRKNQVEAETSRVREQRFNMLPPTWDDSFNNLGEDQLRMFIAALDSKLHECNQTIGLLKAKKSEMPVVPTHDVLDETYLGFMQNMSDEAYVVPAPVMPVVGNDNTDLMSYTPQVQMLQFGSIWNDSFFNNLGEEQQRMFTGSTFNSELQECSNHHTIGLFKTKSVDNQYMGTPVGPLQDISNQSDLSFLQNTTQDNLVSGPVKPVVDYSSTNDLIESYCLEDQVLHFGLENIDLNMLLGLQ